MRQHACVRGRFLDKVGLIRQMVAACTPSRSTCREPKSYVCAAYKCIHIATRFSRFASRDLGCCTRDGMHIVACLRTLRVSRRTPRKCLSIHRAAVFVLYIPTNRLLARGDRRVQFPNEYTRFMHGVTKPIEYRPTTRARCLKTLMYSSSYITSITGNTR